MRRVIISSLVVALWSGCAPAAPVDAEPWESSAYEDDVETSDAGEESGSMSLAPVPEEAESASEPLVIACLSQCNASTMILGCDNREVGPSTEGAAMASPWRHVGRLSTGCTGTLIGPRHVLTAAHCVDDVAGPLTFSLAQYNYGVCSAPYGRHYVRRVYVPAEYGGGATPEIKSWDYAVLMLENPIPGATPMEFDYLSWNTIRDRAEHSVGYPGDKPNTRAWSTGTSYFRDSPHRWLDGGESGLLYVTNDGVGGQSGSPIYVFQGGVRTIVGVFIGAPVADCWAGRTWAARITPETVDRIESIMNPLVFDFRWSMRTLPILADVAPCD